MLQVSSAQDEGVYEAAAATVQYKVDKGGTRMPHVAFKVRILSNGIESWSLPRQVWAPEGEQGQPIISPSFRRACMHKQ